MDQRAMARNTRASGRASPTVRPRWIDRLVWAGWHTAAASSKATLSCRRYLRTARNLLSR